MDVVCHKSGERGGAPRRPHDQYLHTECMTLHMHLMNREFLSVNYTPGQHLSIPHTVLNLPGCPDNGRLFRTTNLQTSGSLLYLYTLTLSLPLLPALSFIAGNSSCNTLYALLVNVMHFFFCPLTNLFRVASPFISLTLYLRKWLQFLNVLWKLRRQAVGVGVNWPNRQF